MLLNLPEIAPEVPAVIEFGGASAAHLQFALALSATGLIRSEDLAAISEGITAHTLRSLSETAICRALCPEFNFALLSAYCVLVIPQPNDADFLDENGHLHLAFIVDAGHPEFIAIGPAFEAIEAAMPGLGIGALSIIESSLYHFGPTHTPRGALELASMYYWLGEENETIALEEYGEDAEVPTREELFGFLPEWCYTTTSIPAILGDAFGEAAARFSGEAIGPLLLAIDNLRRLQEVELPVGIEWGNALDDVETQSPPIVCGWRDPMDFSRIFDDNYNSMMQGGESAPYVARIAFTPTPAGFSAALAAIKHTGNVLKALDTALKLTQENHHEL